MHLKVDWRLVMAMGLLVGLLSAACGEAATPAQTTSPAATPTAASPTPAATAVATPSPSQPIPRHRASKRHRQAASTGGWKRSIVGLSLHLP